MKVSITAPGRCWLRQPPERGEAQRIPTYNPRSPLIAFFFFCPVCGHRVSVTSGITEADPHEVSTEIETSDGGVRTVRHLVPVLTVPEQQCTCGSRWAVSNGSYVMSGAR